MTHQRADAESKFFLIETITGDILLTVMSPQFIFDIVTQNLTYFQIGT